MIKFALITLFSFTTAAPEVQSAWVAEALTMLTQQLEVNVLFAQNGPQAIFYTDELPEGSEEVVLEMLERYRGRAAPNGNVLVIGLRPEVVFIAGVNRPAERLLNTSLVATYASLADGRDRQLGDTNGQSFIGCVSSSSASGSTIRCSDGQDVTRETTCQMYGGEVVCRSTN